MIFQWGSMTHSFTELNDIENECISKLLCDAILWLNNLNWFSYNMYTCHNISMYAWLGLSDLNYIKKLLKSALMGTDVDEWQNLLKAKYPGWNSRVVLKLMCKLICFLTKI